jgi:hypothetical protein
VENAKGASSPRAGGRGPGVTSSDPRGPSACGGGSAARAACSAASAAAAAAWRTVGAIAVNGRLVPTRTPARPEGARSDRSARKMGSFTEVKGWHTQLSMEGTWNSASASSDRACASAAAVALPAACVVPSDARHALIGQECTASAIICRR